MADWSKQVYFSHYYYLSALYTPTADLYIPPSRLVAVYAYAYSLCGQVSYISNRLGQSSTLPVHICCHQEGKKERVRDKLMGRISVAIKSVILLLSLLRLRGNHPAEISRFNDH